MTEYFIGAPVPRDIVQILEKALGGLHAGTPESSKNFHIWLGDLGEQSDEAIEKVTEALERVSVSPFYVSFRGPWDNRGKCPIAAVRRVGTGPRSEVSTPPCRRAKCARGRHFHGACQG